MSLNGNCFTKGHHLLKQAPHGEAQHVLARGRARSGCNQRGHAPRGLSLHRLAQRGVSARRQRQAVMLQRGQRIMLRIAAMRISQMHGLQTSQKRLMSYTCAKSEGAHGLGLHFCVQRIIGARQSRQAVVLQRSHAAGHGPPQICEAVCLAN